MLVVIVATVVLGTTGVLVALVGVSVARSHAGDRARLLECDRRRADLRVRAPRSNLRLADLRPTP